MMKKILFILFSLSLCLIAACSQSTTESEESSSDIESSVVSESSTSSTELTAEETTTLAEASYEEEMTIEFYFGTRTGIYSGDVNDEGLPDGYGSFTTTNEDGEEYTYEGDWVNGHWNGSGKDVWDSGQSYIGEYVNDTRTGQGTLTFSDGTIYEGTFVSDIFCGDGTIYFTDSSRLEGSFTDFLNGSGIYYGADGLRYEGTLTDGDISLILLDDFFGDSDRRAQYIALYYSFSFSELYDYVQAYISEDAVSDTDSAYSIINSIEPILSCDAPWYTEMDELDSSYTVYFEQANEISESISVVPTVTISGGMHIKIGFRRNGWIFFDRIYFGVDGEEIYSKSVKSYDTTRNVISGGLIEEYCFIGNMSDDNLVSMDNGDTVILRFLNYDSQEYYDHTLTQGEVDALYCGMLMENCCEELSDLILDYRMAYKVFD